MKLQLQGATLLLVTQDPLTQAFFERVVKKLEIHGLICTASQKETLDALSRHLISLIIIDEKEACFELTTLCESIHALPEYAHTPILIITGHLKKTFIRLLLKAGATDFLMRPLDEDEFVLRMEMAKKVKQTEQKMSTLKTLFKERATTVSSLDKWSILDGRVLEMIAAALKEKSNLAMLALEIDQYGRVEERHGEKGGKAFLASFEKYLQHLVRQQDLLFNQKKGKFVILLPKTSARGAQLIAEKIQDSLDKEIFLAGDIRLISTVSIGLVTLEEDGECAKNASFNLNRLMQGAKTCLNHAKKKGNRVISHSP